MSLDEYYDLQDFKIRIDQENDVLDLMILYIKEEINSKHLLNILVNQLISNNYTQHVLDEGTYKYARDLRQVHQTITKVLSYRFQDIEIKIVVRKVYTLLNQNDVFVKHKPTICTIYPIIK